MLNADSLSGHRFLVSCSMRSAPNGTINFIVYMVIIFDEATFNVAPKFGEPLDSIPLVVRPLAKC
jgi:hypothetical protein